MIGMATKKSVLLERLALARERRATPTKNERTLKAPAPEPEAKPDQEMGVITDPQRELAAETTEKAMICGWDKAIQTVAYGARISEDRLREILDEALEYQSKADPSGRISGLDDWAREKRGRSSLAARTRA
jgi:hypothetical protein